MANSVAMSYMLYALMICYYYTYFMDGKIEVQRVRVT